jgi:hypothetical protein
VSNLARFNQHPTEERWTGAKYVPRYLKGSEYSAQERRVVNSEVTQMLIGEET